MRWLAVVVTLGCRDLGVAMPAQGPSPSCMTRASAQNPCAIYYMNSNDMHAAPWPTSLQALTPRQIRVLASAPDAHSVSPEAAAGAICNTGGGSTLREIEPPYQYLSPQGRTEVKRRLQRWVGERCVLLKVGGSWSHLGAHACTH